MTTKIQHNLQIAKSLITYDTSNCEYILNESNKAFTRYIKVYLFENRLHAKTKIQQQYVLNSVYHALKTMSMFENAEYVEDIQLVKIENIEFLHNWLNTCPSAKSFYIKLINELDTINVITALSLAELKYRSNIIGCTYEHLRTSKY